MRILLIDIDTLRPDHLGCYGYHRATSPNIDALAADAIRFDNVYASDVPCLPSRTALCTRRFDTRTGVVSQGQALLNDWLDDQLTRSRDGVDPLRVVMAEGGASHVRGYLPKHLDRLRSTGRSTWAEDLAGRYPADVV